MIFMFLITLNLMWIILVSPMLSLMVLSISVILLSIFLNILYKSLKIQLIMMILSIIGGLFILIGMVIMMAPNDYDTPFNYPKHEMVKLLLSFAPLAMVVAFFSLNKDMESISNSSPHYIINDNNPLIYSQSLSNFIICLIILYLALFIIHSILSKFSKSYMFNE